MSLTTTQAVATLERIVAADGSRADAMYELARLYAQEQELGPAQALWQRAIKVRPDWEAPRLALAESHFEAGQFDQSEQVFREALRAIPDSASLHAGFGQLHEDRGRRAEAEASYREALRLRPGWGYALGALLSMPGAGADEATAADAARLLDADTTDDGSRALIGYGLGKYLQAQQRHGEAFAAYRKANLARRRQQGALDRARLQGRIDALIEVFDAAYFESRREFGDPIAAPIFVVGMPRSGTSLVEHILSRHPAISGYGETPFIAALVQRMPAIAASVQRWPQAARDISAPAAQQAAAGYLAQIERARPLRTPRFVDKAPLNVFQLGLIRVLFPNATLILCKRDPRDTLLSIYCENFGLDQNFSTDLGDLAFYYAQYLRLVRHWQQVLGEGLVSIRYEHLVSDHEIQCRRLVQATGEAWSERCLEPVDEDRAVSTPSRWQVRQPLYRTSIGRWKSFEPWLGELIDGLREQGVTPLD